MIHKMQLKKIFFIGLNIFLFEKSFGAPDDLLLECVGSRFVEINLAHSAKENQYRSYEIKRGELVIIKREIQYKYKPIENNSNRLFYSIPKDLGHLQENYYLEFDRISGRVKERHDSYPGKGFWKFEGSCKKTVKKF